MFNSAQGFLGSTKVQLVEDVDVAVAVAVSEDADAPATATSAVEQKQESKLQEMQEDIVKLRGDIELSREKTG